ncbi:hypothetical protein [Shewanella algae]|uniref:hypothetical protein n=1 Tax=Shewanella algae TaxID=38313 RepID=UPI0012616C98|nr:hypothetical protein [Shewanella algae]NKZ40336.1 hypothetical protein [Shewanella algae]QTE76412.1 hypothetical protein E1N14_012535 [Shewanella algae]
MNIEAWDEKTLGVCDCCGNTTRYASGQIVDGDLSYGIYYIFWTEGKLNHYPNFDFILGPCGKGSSQNDRIQVSLVCLTDRETRDFSIINAGNRNECLPYKVAKSLNRDEVIGTKLADHVFSIVDTIWLQDKRIEFMHGN